MTVQRTAPYPAIVEDLAYAYDGVFTREAVQSAVDTAREQLQSVSRIPDFLPVLVAKQAREQLTASAQAEGRIAKRVPEVLFICVHNAGRSQMAAALAEHLSNGRVHVRSAGSDPTDEINPLVVEVLAARGISLTQAYPKPLTDTVVRAADVIITMGCGDTCPYYPGKRYHEWTVADPAGADPATIRDIRDDIHPRATPPLRQILH